MNRVTVRKVKIKSGKYQVTLRNAQHSYIDPKTLCKKYGPFLDIDVGGETAACVLLSVPQSRSTGELKTVEKGFFCSLNPNENEPPTGRPYKGLLQEKNVLRNMVLLGFTFAREYNPSLRQMDLLDTAAYPCIAPDGTKHFVYNTDHDLAFHQQSYYEMRYGAVLLDPATRTCYETDKTAFTDPTRMIGLDVFVEDNATRHELQPHYDASKTWKEFFDRLYRSYPPEILCTLIYQWISVAVVFIMNNHNYVRMRWTIDITKDTPINYTSSRSSRGGGTRKRRPAFPSDEIPVRDFSKQNWKGFLEKYHSRQHGSS